MQVSPSRFITVHSRRSSEPFPDPPSSIRLDLQSHPFFSSLSKDEIDKIMSCIHIRRYYSGDIVVKEGDEGEGMFLILKGTAEVYSEKFEVSLAELHKGSFFGEISLLYHITRTANVRARTSLVVAVIKRAQFLDLVKSDDMLLQVVSKEAQRRYDIIRPRNTSFHQASSFHILSQMKFHFKKTFQHLDDKYLMDVIKRSEYHEDSQGRIVSFYSKEPSSLPIFLVFNGTVSLKDPLNDSTSVYESGSVAKFTEGCSQLAHLVAESNVSHLSIKSEVYYALLNSSPLIPTIETLNLQEQEINETSTVNILADTFGSVQSGRRRRNTVDHVFWHEQEPHISGGFDWDSLGSEDPLMASDIVNQDLADVVNIQNVLSAHKVSVNPLSIMPLGDARYLELSVINGQLTDTLLADILSAIDGECRTLSLNGCILTDSSLSLLKTHLASHLTELHIQDGLHFSSTNLKSFLCSCTHLKNLHLKNCHGFTDAVLEAMADENIGLQELELSFLRNIGSNCWEQLVRFAPSLHSLTLHRLMALEEANIRHVPIAIPFSHLRSLNISESAFITTNALRAMLAGMPSLRELNLSFCTGVDETIYKAIPLENHIDSIDISYCLRLGSDRAFGQLLAKLPHLTSLKARNIRHPTKRALEILGEMNQLKEVDLKGCPLIEGDLEEAGRKYGWTL